jgi:diadenylate cyclase
LSWQYGTRHRAAIGLTEISDSRCIVVSEETGTISMVEAGKLEKVPNSEELRKTLARMYQVNITGTETGISRIPLGARISEFFAADALPQPIQKILQGGRSSRPDKSENLPKSGTGA